QQKMTQLGEQETAATGAYGENLRRLQEQTPVELRMTTRAANRAGGLYSGALGRQLGDIRTTAIRREAGLLSDYQAGQRARAEARRALEEGATVEEAAARAEAIDRQTNRDQQAASERALVAESAIPADQLDAGVDVGTPSPRTGRRRSTQATPSYLPRGYAGWDLARRRSYWQRRRKARR
ncbi:MAG TPA: hypothetical protein VFG86_01995, partial [Chloroflexota bacterium]|nr:hypothetical protein [Chloroflexota bacterium]